MAHPEQMTLDQRRKQDFLSPLMRAKARAQKQEVINFCPFGCEIKDLDDNGYCRHLVGFTNDGRKYERMIWRGRRRVVSPRFERTGTADQQGNPAMDHGEWAESPINFILEDVLATDQLVRITVSSRVYRDVDGAGEKLLARQEEARRAEQAEQRRLLLQDMRQDPETKQWLMDELTK